jgi:hypothetical protein
MTVTTDPCTNIRTGETEPCGQPNDGRPSVPGYPSCAECRAAANAIGLAAVAIVAGRAAEIERKDAAA